jgi:hypothetical protein
MNAILITEKALNKLYLLGSIEFLATLKCFIIVFCFLPAEFKSFDKNTQKCPNLQDMSELRDFTVPGRPKNLRIWIRNTGYNLIQYLSLHQGTKDHERTESLLSPVIFSG